MTEAAFYSRLENRRFAGFPAFVVNKAFAVTDAVPQGHLWLIFALSAFHTGAQRIIHLFVIPQGDADKVINPNSDTTSSIFTGALNNPPLKSGVLISTGGASSLVDMQSATSNSVQGLWTVPFILPAGWKILAAIDSAEGVIPGGDGMVIDMAVIDVTSDECIPDFL